MLIAAQSLASRLPPLLVAADRVAATVAQGVHGRRRAGVGDSFWQYRPYVPGDMRIDWRRSARSERLFVRDTEWEAAQTVCLWHDQSPSMAWRSSKSLPEKRERARLLLLALAGLLFRAGEQVRHVGLSRAFTSRNGLEALDAAWPQNPGLPAGLPGAAGVPRHAQLVLAGDFLAPLPEIAASLAGFAGLPARVHLLQVLDPAELELPYAGRVRFRGVEGDGEALISRVETVRGEYGAALQARLSGLRALAAAQGFTVGLHRTDHPPEPALLSLFTALDAGARRA